MPAYTRLTIRENLRLVKESEACRVHFIIAGAAGGRSSGLAMSESAANRLAGSKTLGRVTRIVLQQAAQPFATLIGPWHARSWSGEDSSATFPFLDAGAPDDNGPRTP
jgi:hypothetical protein